LLSRVISTRDRDQGRAKRGQDADTLWQKMVEKMVPEHAIRHYGRNARVRQVQWT